MPKETFDKTPGAEQRNPASFIDKARRALHGFAALRDLLPLVSRAERRRFVFLLACAFFLALVELALTGMIALLVAVFASPERVMRHKVMAQVSSLLRVPADVDPRMLALGLLSCILLTIIFKNLFTIWQQWELSTFTERLTLSTRCHVFRFYLRAPWLWLSATGPADLNFALTAAQMSSQAVLKLLNITTYALMVLVLLCGLMAVAPGLSLLLVGGLGLGGGLFVLLARRAKTRLAEKVYKAKYRLEKLQYLGLHAMREIRLYTRESALYDDYVAASERVPQASRRLAAVSQLPLYALEILAFLALLGMLLYMLGQDASMTRISGVMGFMAAACWRALRAVNRLFGSMNSLPGLAPYLDKFREYLRLERRMREEGRLSSLAETPAGDLPFSRAIRFEEVRFSYPEAPAPTLSGLSFTIPKGRMLGLVGVSGAGKSTLVNLLTGLIPPESGGIFIDDAPLDGENARRWRGRLGYVSQSPYIMDASLADNVALARWGEPVDRERVAECCRMAAVDFLDDLAQGMDTVLGERGIRLSGGQAQRVAIARALYNRPDLIVFDEATSALDQKNESAIYQTILSLRRSVTIVVIAHRLRTVEGCDTLVWLDKGRVRMQGPPDEVLPEYEAFLESSVKSGAADPECSPLQHSLPHQPAVDP